MTIDPGMMHTAKFNWDDGQGESFCSPLYLETRDMLRMAAGKAAEARLVRDHALAEQFEFKVRTLTSSLERLRTEGHLGVGRRFHESDFATAFAKASGRRLEIL